jgi:hypothetical protein
MNINIKNINTIYNQIGLSNPNNNFYKGKEDKHQQVITYCAQIISIINKLSSKRDIVMLDCGCGKSYLSFILYAYCSMVLKRKIKIIGIDTNAYASVIDKCKDSAEKLGFKNMYFDDVSITDFQTNSKIDIVYSLHACDTATDQTIALGIKHKAKYIFSVSCCQHTSRNKISGHPLTAVSRYQPYKERLADMISDSMRALLLESNDYGVRIFEFTSQKHTPKNIMLRAVRNQVKKKEKDIASINYNNLTKMFKFRPVLERLISDFQENSIRNESLSYDNKIVENCI